MQNDDLKNNIQQILGGLKSDGDKLVRDFEKTLEQYQRQLVAELSKSSSKNTETNS